MNLHREPSLHDPNRARINLSLRRRIWWTVFVSSLFQSFLSLHLHLRADEIRELPHISDCVNEFVHESFNLLYVIRQLIHTT